jgi:hypothetical protein
MDGGTN